MIDRQAIENAFYALGTELGLVFNADPLFIRIGTLIMDDSKANPKPEYRNTRLHLWNMRNGNSDIRLYTYEGRTDCGFSISIDKNGKVILLKPTNTNKGSAEIDRFLELLYKDKPWWRSE